VLYYTRSCDVNVTEGCFKFYLIFSLAFKAWAIVTSMAALGTSLVTQQLLTVCFRSW